MKKVLFAVLALWLATGCSSQQVATNNDNQPPQQGQRQNPPSIDKLFKQMDINKDGQLAKAEVKGSLANDFDKVDTNNDGFISREELEKAPKPPRGQRPPRQGN